MSDVLGIYGKELDDAVRQMRQSYGTFSSFSSSCFQSEISSLEGMNSDFTEKLERVLGIVKDWKLGSLSADMGHYIQTAESIFQEMQRVDAGIAERVSDREGAQGNG